MINNDPFLERSNILSGIIINMKNQMEDIQDALLINTEGSIVCHSSEHQTKECNVDERILKISRNIFLFDDTDFSQILIRGTKNYVLTLKVNKKLAVLVILNKPTITGLVYTDLKRYIQMMRDVL